MTTSNIHTPRRRRERKKGVENVFDEIIVENFLDLKKEIDVQVQEAKRVPNKMKPKRPTPRHVIIKMPKVKEIILKAAREKQRVTYKGTPLRLSADFSAEILQAKREWNNIFNVLKGKNLQSRILYQQGYHSELKER